jgi:segregation and condensation protein A
MSNDTCLAVLRGRDGRADAVPVYRPAIPTLWRVPDALARLRTLLAAHPAGGFLQQFLPPLAPDEPDRRLATRAAIASTFVAGLELARTGTAQLDQGEAFGAIHLAAADHQRAQVFDSVAA